MYKITRGSIIEKMENMLIIWMQDMIQRKVPLSGSIIRNKALLYFQHLKRNDQAN